MSKLKEMKIARGEKIFFLLIIVGFLLHYNINGSLIVRNSFSLSHSFSIAKFHLNKIFEIATSVILLDVHFCHLINTDFIL